MLLQYYWKLRLPSRKVRQSIKNKHLEISTNTINQIISYYN